MLENRYRYALEFFKSDGAPLGRLPVDVDWEPALEHARFETLRRGVCGAAAYGASAAVQPLWSQETGEPHVDGFFMSLEPAGGPPAVFSFPRRYFRALASNCAAHFIHSGKLTSAETFRYRVVAFPEMRLTSPPAAQFEMEELPVELPIRNVIAPPALEAAELVWPGIPGDLKAFVPAAVLDEIAIQARQAGEKETGGFLIGYLCRDMKSSDLFVSITGQLPAEQALAESTRLTFTPATWTAARSTLNLRRRDEMFLGWFHSHPSFSWCRECSTEDRKQCRTAKDFFSAHDHLLHRTAFPQAYSLGLVANVIGEGAEQEITFSTFGWREGIVQLRGLQVNAANELTGLFQGEGYVASHVG